MRIGSDPLRNSDGKRRSVASPAATWLPLGGSGLLVARLAGKRFPSPDDLGEVDSPVSIYQQ
jgi:hypothetical protein